MPDDAQSAPEVPVPTQEELAALALAAMPPAPEQPAAVVGTVDPPLSIRDRILADLNRWMFDRIYGSPVSQATAAFNHLSAEIPGLADRLAVLVA